MTSARGNAFLGKGPDRDPPSTGQLTAVGVALLVSLPLCLLGSLLLSIDS